MPLFYPRTIVLTSEVSGVLPVANGGTNYSGGAWTETTPTPTAGAGSFTTATSSLWNLKIGRLVHLHGVITVTTVGTADTAIIVTLPYNSARGGSFTALNGSNLLEYPLRLTTTSLLIYMVAGGGPGAVQAGTYSFNLDYESAS